MKSTKITVISGFSGKDELLDVLKPICDENGCLKKGYEAYYRDEHNLYPVDIQYVDCYGTHEEHVRVWYENNAERLKSSDCKDVEIYVTML